MRRWRRAIPFESVFRRVDPAHSGLRRKGDELGPRNFGDGPSPQSVFFGQDHDAPAFRRLVGKGGQLGGVGQLIHRDPLGRDELHRLPVADGNRAGFVEQQNVDVTRGLNGPAAHGQNVFLHQPVDPGDADGAQQAADGRWQQTDQERHQDGDAEHPRGRTVREISG